MVEVGGIPSFESGKVMLSTGDLQVLKVDLTSTRIEIDVEDKAFIKRIIAMRNELIPKMPGPSADRGGENPAQIGSALSTARSVAEALCSRGITITFSYKSHLIATIGAKAHPTLLHHITKTRGIALNSMYTAIKMLI
jgi:hypothetical protein